jgi:hypothetical protein
MKRYLLPAIIIVESVLIVTLLSLINQNNFPDKVGTLIIWLLPISFGLHVTEEFVFPGGFDTWYREYRPEVADNATNEHFFKINLLPAVISIILAITTFGLTNLLNLVSLRIWLALLMVLSYNGILHIKGSFDTKKYSPGTITSVTLYFPLAITSIIYFIISNRLDFISLFVCIGIGPLFWVLLDRSNRSESKL